MAIAPDFALALNGLGRVYLEKQMFAEAKEKLAAYLVAAPEASDAAEAKLLVQELDKLLAKQ